MKWFVLFFSIVCGLFVFVGEWWSSQQKKIVQRSLHQGAHGTPTYARAFLFTSILALLVSVTVAFSQKSWGEPRRGVAFVLDTKDVDSLSGMKGVCSDIVDSLEGVSVSLYECQGSTIVCTVPQTIDRIFFNLILDGVSSSSSVRPSISTIQERVFGHYSYFRPWVVILSSHIPYKDSADGITVLSVNQKLSRKTIQSISQNILAHLQQAAEESELYPMTRIVLVVFLCIAWLSFLYWSKIQAPLMLVLLFVSIQGLYSLSEHELNQAVLNAKESAQIGAWKDSEQLLEKTLKVVSNKKLRSILLYNRSVVSYSQQKYQEAFRFASMEEFEGAFQENLNLLQGLCLLRILQEFPNERYWKQKLQQWEEKKGTGVVSQALIIQNLEKKQNETLFWLQQEYETCDSTEFCHYEKEIEKRLIDIYPKEIVELFRSEVKEWQKSPFFFYFWEIVANSSSLESGFGALLHLGAHISGNSLYFPGFDTRLLFMEKMRGRFEKHLSHEYQVGLKLLSEEGRAYTASLWYAQATLWPVIASDRCIAVLAQVLSEEIDALLGNEAKEQLALFSIRAFSLFKEEKSLERVLQKVYTKLFCQDAEQALSVMVPYLTRSQEWESRFIELVRTYDATTPFEKAVQVEPFWNAYEIKPLCHLWQIAVVSDVEKQVRYDKAIFEDLVQRGYSEKSVRTLALATSLQPILIENAVKHNFSDTNKQETYEFLLQEWVKTYQRIWKQLASEQFFSVEKIENTMVFLIQVLQKIERLFQGQEKRTQLGGYTKKSFSIQDPIRLFQEMDRADRELRR